MKTFLQITNCSNEITNRYILIYFHKLYTVLQNLCKQLVSTYIYHHDLSSDFSSSSELSVAFFKN